jgi:hypothetical protein
MTPFLKGWRFAGIWVLVALALTTSPKAQTPVAKIAMGEPVESPAAKDVPCYADSCSDRREVSVKLPKGAVFVAAHLFTTAGTPFSGGFKCDNDARLHETGPTEVCWGRFSDISVFRDNTGQVVITAYYYNRSDRNRKASVNAEYR